MQIQMFMVISYIFKYVICRCSTEYSISFWLQKCMAMYAKLAMAYGYTLATVYDGMSRHASIMPE